MLKPLGMRINRYHALALLSALGVSVAPMFFRWANVSPATASFYRGVYAFPLLWMLSRCVERNQVRSWHARGFGVLAGISLGVCLLFWYRSIDALGVGLSTLITNTQVVFVAVLAWMIFKERTRAVAWWLLPLIMLGAWMITGDNSADAESASMLKGLVDGVIAAIASACTVILLRPTGAHAGTRLAATADVAFGTAFCACTLGALLEGGFVFSMSGNAHLWVALTALCSQIIGWLPAMIAMQHLPALEVTIVLFTQPLFSMLWAVLFFGEHFSSWQLVGALLLIVGVVFFQLLSAHRASLDESLASK